MTDPNTPAPNTPQSAPEPPAPEAAAIDYGRVEAYFAELRAQQSLMMGALAGLAAALVGAAAWGGVTYLTNYKIGFVAIGVGFIVGYAVRIAGKGLDPIFGVVGAVLAGVGCLLGNVFMGCAVLSSTFQIPFFQLLSNLTLSFVIELIKATFSPMDLVFYAIALYEGYQFSFRQVTSEEIAAVLYAQDFAAKPTGGPGFGPGPGGPGPGFGPGPGGPKGW
jgi:hypothetical protein